MECMHPELILHFELVVKPDKGYSREKETSDIDRIWTHYSFPLQKRKPIDAHSFYDDNGHHNRNQNLVSHKDWGYI